MERKVWLVSMCLVFGCSGTQSARTPAAAPTESVAANPLVAACEAGTVKSCLNAASSAESAGDLVEAARLYSKACDLGDATGCALAGAALAQAPDTQGEAGAAFEQGCAMGDGASCYGAGLIWAGTFGGERDAARAAAAFSKGCDAGLVDACGAFADALEGGEGVTADPERAAQLRESACEQGDGASCITLARAEREGGDEATANEYLERACATDGRGCTQRGLVELDGDAAAAREWFQRGCVAALPDPDACGWYGWFASEGIGGAASPDGPEVLRATCEADGALACMFGAVLEDRAGRAPAATALLERACAVDAGQCEAMRLQFQGLTAAP